MKEIIFKTKNEEEGWIFVASKETCSFCNKGKIVYGLYIHFNPNSEGYPCCEDCYDKEGFEEWLEKCKKINPDIASQLRLAVDMFFREQTPEEAVKDMTTAV